jgi:hypothetical protein
MNVHRFLLAVVVLAGMIVMSYSGAFAQGIQFFAVLNGGNEVSATGQANAGDPNGFGSAAVMIRDSTTICFAILVNAIAPPTAAHIHDNFAGRNGPVVVPFVAPSTGNPGTSSGCVSNLNSTLVARIRNNPSRFYVNVHNNQFPAGAIRGQLF